MAKNPIQYQKGLSLTDFLAQYGDESKWALAPQAPVHLSTLI